MLPPPLGEILISNSTTAMITYRVLRDGSIPSSISLVRKVMSGCGKSCIGRLLRNLAHHSQKSLHLASSSAALLHHLPTPKATFPYHEDTEKIQYETTMENEQAKKNESWDYPTANKWHLQQEGTRTL